MARGRSRLVGGICVFLMSWFDAGRRALGCAPALRRCSGWRTISTGTRAKAVCTGLSELPGEQVLQLLCMIAGALMPLLEVVPFSSSILGAAVLSFSVGLLRRDGIFAVAGIAILSIAAVIPMVFLQSVFW